jgi:hypothetical protein
MGIAAVRVQSVANVRAVALQGTGMRNESLVDQMIKCATMAARQGEAMA